jgi:cysteine synthase A
LRHESILGTIGGTPLVRLTKMSSEDSSEVFCKLESFNPMHSVKDRIALAMIEDAERSGKLKPGMCVIEPTSGNTGIGLAMVCAVKGYPLTLTMPETMSVERRKLLKALGAEIVLTPGSERMDGAIKCAKNLCRKGKGAFMPMQFDNPANPLAHRVTAAEILKDLPDVDIFVAGIGTGGTITGVGKALKEHRQEIRIIGVEPSASAVLTGGRPGPHGIQGIGAGFVPKTLDRRVVDWIFPVNDEDAKRTTRELAKKEGILAGISSGAALCIGLQMAKQFGPGKKMVVLLPDTGERYLSTDLFPE